MAPEANDNHTPSDRADSARGVDDHFHRLSIPEAFQPLLHHYRGAGHLARQRLHEALKIGGDAPGGVRLWIGDTAVDPSWYAGHMQVAAKEVSDGQWSAELEPSGLRPVKPGLGPWSVSAADIDALIRLEQEAATVLDKLEQESRTILDRLEQQSRTIREVLITLDRLEQETTTKEAVDKLKQGLEQELKATNETLDKLKRGTSQRLSALAEPPAERGRKPYEWELFRAKFYLMLYDDDVPAHANISASQYADKLMAWGGENLGEEETPEQSQMRGKIAEWKPLWKQLKNFNK